MNNSSGNIITDYSKLIYEQSIILALLLYACNTCASMIIM